MLIRARAERDEILKEAKTLQDKIVSEAKNEAQNEGAKMIAQARREIEDQKNKALAEVKEQVSTLSLDIARKLLEKEFEDPQQQKDLVDELLKDVRLN